MCVVPYDDIPVGVAYIREKMNEGSLKDQFSRFWDKYYMKTWMRKSSHHTSTGLFLFTSWNMSHLIDENGCVAVDDETGCDVLMNRTNNPLERFNRKMNEKVPIHPPYG